MEFYIPENYPASPPKVYVRPTSSKLIVVLFCDSACFIVTGLPIDMIIKPGHRNVDTEGFVMVPYISNWNGSNPANSSMLELCNILCGVFSSEPPLFSKPVSVASTSSSKQRNSWGSSEYHVEAIKYGSGSTSGSTSSANTNSYNNSFAGANPSVTSKIMNQYYGGDSTSLSTASPPAYPAGAGTASYYTTNTLSSSNAYSYTSQATMKRQALVEKLAVLLKSELHTVLSNTASALEKEMETQQELETANNVELPNLLKTLTDQKKMYQEGIHSINKKTVQLESWEKEMVQLDSDSGNVSDGNDGDDASTSKSSTAAVKFDRLVHYDDISLQLVKLTAENNAVDDAIYYLDHALAHGEGDGLDIQEVLKETRKLARKQFLCRTHVMKVNFHVLANS